MSFGNVAPRSFSAFYQDESITGHIFLAPSLYVSETVSYVISPLNQTGCSALVDVIKRIFLSLLCLLIALPCALLIIPGLFIKSLSLCVCSRQLHLVQSHSTQPIEEYQFITKTHSSHRKIDEVLQDVWLKIVIKKRVQEAEKLLNSAVIKEFEKNKPTPKKNAPPTEEERLYDRIAELRVLIHHYNYYKIRITEKQEITTEKEGNCAFEAFATAFNLHANANVQDASVLRKETMQSIQNNVFKNKSLREHIVQGMHNFYSGELETLKEELDREKSNNNAPEYVKHLNTSIQIFEHTVKVIDQAISDDKWEKLSVYLHEYCQILSTPGVFVSVAELYVMAINSNRCVEILDEDHKITNTLNKEAASFGTLKIVHKNGDHFEPYIPKATLA